MRTLWLVKRSLIHYATRHFAVLAGVVVGTAVLTGALLVGDSVRGSLRQLALDRLGSIEYTLVANRFFRAALANDLRTGSPEPHRLSQCQPAILLRASVGVLGLDGRERSVAGRVQVVGVLPEFWSLAPGGAAQPSPLPNPDANEATVNAVLARELSCRAGDQLVIRMEGHSAVPRESVLGRKTDTIRTLPVELVAVLDSAAQFSRFSVEPNQHDSRTIFVPLTVLQRAVQRPGGANTLLLASGRSVGSGVAELTDSLQRVLRERIEPADADIEIRTDAERGYVSIESGRMILEPAVLEAGLRAASRGDIRAAGTLVQLAIAIENRTRGRAEPGSAAPGAAAAYAAAVPRLGGVPYSTIVACDVSLAAPLGPLALADGAMTTALGDDEILLNEWAAAELAARPGDEIAVRYFSNDHVGAIQETEAVFRLRGIVAIKGVAADPGLVPTYRGVTDARTLDDWDPPFPMDHSRIRRADEEYWRTYRTTPKAFVSLVTGERLWAGRFGKWTSLRLATSDATRVASLLRAELDPARLGLSIHATRARALAAAQGATDFAGLFIGFSFFLIVSAVLLVGLLFRLGVERRAREVGILRAIGYAPAAVRRLFLLEGAAVAATGSVVGAACGLGFAWVMLAGLRTWWFDAVRTSELYLHVAPLSVTGGGVCGFVLALGGIWWAVRRQHQDSPRSLLSGSVTSDVRTGSRSAGIATWLAGSFAVLAAVVLVVGAMLDMAVAAFFAGGAAALVASLAALTVILRREPTQPPRCGGWLPLTWLAARNAARQVGRSVLTAGLIASATFVIVAVAASRHDSESVEPDRKSGDGGFRLMGESDLPLYADPGTVAGRAALGLSDAANSGWDNVRIFRLRSRPGDDASCLNLYRPHEPRLLGAPAELIARGGFRFAKSLATDLDRDNPWRLLERPLSDGSVPAIGDANTLQWILHLGLGDSLKLNSEQGESISLTMVGALDRSIFQGELLIAESQFARLFPSRAGYSTLLVEAPLDRASHVTESLERSLRSFGLDVTTTAARLAEYRSVENTYLETFQTLGGLGLLLGTVGLGAVLFRGVIERRGELALLRAVGYTRGSLTWLVLAENLLLLWVGLTCGGGSALLAVGGNVWHGGVSWLSLAGTLGFVFLGGGLSGTAAVTVALRGTLLPALRSE